MELINKARTCILRCLRSRRLVGLTFTIAFLCCAFLAQVAASAQARYITSSCRGDPVVLLSNGVKLNLVVWINRRDASHVDHVLFILHIPQGESVVSVSYDRDDSPFYKKELFYQIADQPANQYEVHFVVLSRRDRDMHVIAYAQATDSNGTTNAANSPVGGPNQDLSLLLSLVQGNQNDQGNPLSAWAQFIAPSQGGSPLIHSKFLMHKGKRRW